MHSNAVTAEHLDLAAILDESPQSDPTRRIYANRNLDLSRVDVIGFDMDYTLAPYHQHAMDELSIRMTVDKLIKNRGYPEELRTVVLDHAFIIRGLMIDKETGNIFKMDAHRHVGRCYHGYRQLSEDVRMQEYGTRPIKLASGRYHWVDTLFALPEATLLAGIIEHFEGAGRTLPWSYRQLFDDVRQSIDEAHADNSLKAEILAHLDRYIVKDPDLAPTLHKLRSAGKRLFLLTNSEMYYTEAVMGHLLGGEMPFYRTWQDYFDLIVVSAAKPRFFTDESPFLEIDSTGKTIGEAASLKRGAVYSGGNIRQLEETLDVPGGRILYVGDHMYSDIVRSRKASIWRTALVVQEMEDNIRQTHVHAEDLKRIHDLAEAARRLDDGINYHLTLLKSLGRMQQLLGRLTGPESRVIDRARESARVELEAKRGLQRRVLAELETLEADVDRRFNPYWGRIFREGNERSQLGAQVQGYACIYTSRVSNFLAYSPNQVFRAPREVMPHERV
ncbi:MAG: HAD-IG family 5'-nucleotidase [Myxococcales bacterium]|nr:HAD-IG family 5'-nucleotidase [Myxococcales bacterium]